MKLKYYLRGIGIGVVVTTIILTIALSGKTKEMSDLDVINRAKELGMVMEETEESLGTEETNTEATEITTEIVSTEANQNETNSASNTSQETNVESTDVNNADSGTAASEAANQTSDATTQNEIVSFQIEQGQYARQVSESLYAQGLVDDAEGFRKYLQTRGGANTILVGTYQIPRGATYEEIANILYAGPVNLQ